MANHPVHGRIDGPIVMIGFGSIGKGMLPLLERHIAFDRSKFVVIDPVDTRPRAAGRARPPLHQGGLTKANHREVLTPLLNVGPGRGMIVNLSVDTSSVDLMELCNDLDATTSTRSPSRGSVSMTTRSSRCRSARTTPCASACSICQARARPGGITAVSCCGANPGMVSWFVKQALLDVAATPASRPATRRPARTGPR